jgi:hypothetical protein
MRFGSFRSPLSLGFCLFESEKACEVLQWDSTD